MDNDYDLNEEDNEHQDDCGCIHCQIDDFNHSDDSLDGLGG